MGILSRLFHKKATDKAEVEPQQSSNAMCKEENTCSDSHKVKVFSPAAVKEGIKKFEHQEKKRLDNTSSSGPKCENCNKAFGIVPSLGFAAGGYRCENCGLRFCMKCGHDAAVAVERATMLCPKCQSDKTKSFRI